MCSISGIWRFAGPSVTRREIEGVNNATAYRGPDGEGIYTAEAENLALGHRRLSILDLSDAGRQPMESEDGKLIITFNGEIYNYVELRQELQSKGRRFKTGTDTEVILAAYQEWGEACLLRFNGMWAFAIWNVAERSLFLSRDRFGVKPLYYIHQPGKLFAFASEPVAFKHLEGFTRSFSAENLTVALRHSFYLESVGETIYREVRKLLPGYSLRVNKNGEASFQQWWKTEEHFPEVPDTYNEQVEMFRGLFQSACELRLRSDVPVGIALSGGLDSSTVYSTVQHIYKERVRNNGSYNSNWKNAFIASFPDTAMDEKEYADEVVNYTGGVANYIYPSNATNLADALCAETKWEDFVYLTPPVVHNIYGEMRAKNVIVSLDGHGADEMLFGYAPMVQEYLTSHEAGEQTEELQNAWAEMTGTSVETLKQRINREKAQAQPAATGLKKYIPQSLKSLYRKRLKNRANNSSWLLQKPDYSLHTHPIRPVFADKGLQICYNETHISLPTLLRNWDRASMRHGIEIRMPFLDWRVVTFLLSLPTESKLGGGYTKRIVRDAMKGYMPDSIRLRKNKIGINAPIDEWFNGPLSAFVLDAVHSQSFLQSSVWNGPAIRDFVQQQTKAKTWNSFAAYDVWPFINAWILMN